MNYDKALLLDGTNDYCSVVGGYMVNNLTQECGSPISRGLK